MNERPLPVRNQAFLDAIINTPIHRHFGLNLTCISPDLAQPTATAVFVTTAAHLTPTNTLHGGIISSCLDSICFIAAIPSLATGEGENSMPIENAATVSSSYQLIGGVSGEGKLVEFEGKVLRRGKNMVFCESIARCDGRLIGKGSLTKMLIKVPVVKNEAKSKI
jgi:acyl-coenzyme A thioesterase PaaI-like protein